MNVLKTIGRVILIIIAIFVILLSVAGIGGTWYVNRIVTDITLQVFTVVETGVAIAETGVNQVNTLVIDSRTEVQLAEQTILDVSDHLQENSPVLVALNNRLETRLAPTVEKIDAAIAPIRDGLVATTSIVEIANSIPFIQEQAPNLGKVEEVLQNVNQLGADIRQLNDTLGAAVVEEKNLATEELAGVLTDLTTRIDTRLGEVQSEVEALVAEVNAFQEEVRVYKSRLLLIYNLTAIGSTLLFIWLIYSQICVILSQWRGIRKKSSVEDVTEPALEPGATEAAELEPGDEAETSSVEADSSETSSVVTSIEDVSTEEADAPQTDVSEEQADDVSTDDEGAKAAEAP